MPGGLFLDNIFLTRRRGVEVERDSVKVVDRRDWRLGVERGDVGGRTGEIIFNVQRRGGALGVWEGAASGGADDVDSSSVSA